MSILVFGRKSEVRKRAELKELIIEARRVELAEWRGALGAMIQRLTRFINQIDEFERKLA